MAGSPAVRAVDPGASLAIASEDVTLPVGGRSIGATVVHPTAPGKYPALLLMAGSGPTDRDWNNPLIQTRNGSGKLLAEALAAHGMVVIRWDKAGTGGNKGPPLAELTLDTYRDEGLAALDLVAARRDVRTDAIFVAGHSEGGVHATRLAQAAGARVKGVILLSAAGRRMSDLVVEQLASQFAHTGMTPAQQEQQMAPIRTAFDDFLAGRAVDPQQVSQIPQVRQLIAVIVRPETAQLARPLFGFDAAAEAAKLPQHAVFVGGGGKDVQVDPKADGGRLRDAMHAAGIEVTFIVVPDMDHVLKHEPRSVEEIRGDLAGTQAAYNAPGRALDADFVAALSAWLAAETKVRG